jgi:hypothetical protein
MRRGRPGSAEANTANNAGLKSTNAPGRGHDHEGLVVLPRYKAFTTPQSFMKPPFKDG